MNYLVDLELILDNLKLTNNKGAFDYLDTVIKCIKKDNNIPYYDDATQSWIITE